jgi:predicted DNA-binding transcriptional regulator AlpA
MEVAMRLLRFPAVYEHVSAGRTAKATRVWLWRAIRRGAFPAPMKLSRGVVAWREDEVLDWIATRPRAGGSRPAA